MYCGMYSAPFLLIGQQMPIMKCSKNGQSGYKFGNEGTCYIGTNAKQKAIKQALAIGKGKYPEDKDERYIDMINKLEDEYKNVNTDSDYHHIAIIRNREEFEGGKFECEWNANGLEGLHYYKGKLKEGSNSNELDLQRIEFYYEQFTEQQAIKYLEENKIDYIKFIPAGKTIDEDINDFVPPPYPKGMAEKYVKILKATYSSVRSQWVKEHPKDPENQANKEKAAKIAWNAVEEAGYKKPKKDDSVQRFDVFDLTEENMTEPFRSTPEGYLRGRAIIANTGIQTYVQKDGTMLRELREPEEVGNIDSLNSFKNMPLTSGHPKEAVTAENVKDLQVGFTGSDVRFDGHAVSIDMTITDKKTIDEIKLYGRYAVSAGYAADLEMKDGFAFGNNPYNAIQKNIRANHIAVNIDRARAGDLAKIKLRMDSLDAIHIEDISVSDKNNSTIKETRIMAKIKINDVEYEADARVAEEFNIVKKDNEDLKKANTDLETSKKDELSKLQADRDTLADKLKTANEDNEKLKKELNDETVIKEKTKERIALVDTAVKNEIEVTDEMDNADIRKAVILKAFPNATLEDKDESYITARYDSAIEILVDKNTQANKQAVTDIKPDVTKTQKVDEEVLRKRRLRNEWKLTQDQAEKYRNGVMTDDIKKILEEE